MKEIEWSSELGAQLKNGALSATKMSVGTSEIAQHVHGGHQKSSRYRKEQQCSGKVAGTQNQQLASIKRWGKNLPIARWLPKVHVLNC